MSRQKKEKTKLMEYSSPEAEIWEDDEERKTKIDRVVSVLGGRPEVWDNEKELQRSIASYIVDTRKKGQTPTMSGLAARLGVNRCTLTSYSTRDKFSNTIFAAKRLMEEAMEHHLLTSRNQIGAIFSLKNNFGWIDRVDVTQTNLTIDDVINQLNSNGGVAGAIDGEMVTPGDMVNNLAQ